MAALRGELDAAEEAEALNLALRVLPLGVIVPAEGERGGDSRLPARDQRPALLASVQASRTAALAFSHGVPGWRRAQSVWRSDSTSSKRRSL